MPAVTAIVALGCWLGIPIRSALASGDHSAIAAVFLFLNLTGLSGPFLGGWLGVCIARRTQTPASYLGPAGIIVGLAVSALCFTLARPLAFELAG